MLKIFNILQANKQVSELTVQVSDLTAQVDQLTKENATLKEQAAVFSLGSQDWAAEKETLIKSHEEAIKALEEKYNKDTGELAEVIQETKTEVAQQAAQIVASIGIEPETIKTSAVPSDGDILSKFAALTGAEKQAFYQENRDVIIKALGLKR